MLNKALIPLFVISLLIGFVCGRFYTPAEPPKIEYAVTCLFGYRNGGEGTASLSLTRTAPITSMAEMIAIREEIQKWAVKNYTDVTVTNTVILSVQRLPI